MSYYDKRTECFKRLEKTLKESPDAVRESVLLFAVMQKYGFGKGILNKILEPLIEVGYVEKIEADEEIYYKYTGGKNGN